VNSEQGGPFALWQLALYIAVLGFISMLLAPLSSFWWIVPLAGAVFPIALVVVQGRQSAPAPLDDAPDAASPAPEELAETSGEPVADEVAALPGSLDAARPALAEPTPPNPSGIVLSDRERDVLQALASGKTNAEVADALFISVGTVKSHSANIYRKLEAKNRTEAVARARELGLLQ
jgi:DNA-binding CsgD family transcriptional regulator